MFYKYLLEEKVMRGVCFEYFKDYSNKLVINFVDLKFF